MSSRTESKLSQFEQVEEPHLELQPVMPSNGPRGRGPWLIGVRSAPIPPKPPELLPQVVYTLAEVHLQGTAHLNIALTLLSIHAVSPDARLVSFHRQDTLARIAMRGTVNVYLVSALPCMHTVNAESLACLFRQSHKLPQI